MLGLIENKSQEIVSRLYKQLIRPHLEYAIQAWSPWLCKDKQLIEKVQRRAPKMIQGMQTRLLKTVQDKTTFTDAFMSEIPDLRTHCQRISNQYSEIRLLKQLLMSMTEVTLQVDYAENWAICVKHRLVGVLGFNASATNRVISRR